MAKANRVITIGKREVEVKNLSWDDMIEYIKINKDAIPDKQRENFKLAATMITYKHKKGTDEVEEDKSRVNVLGARAYFLNVIVPDKKSKKAEKKAAAKDLESI